MKKQIHHIKIFFLFTFFILFIFSCKNDKEESYGKLQFNFNFNVNGSNLKTDTFLYTNAAGNPYLINNVQYFISNIALIKNDGSTFRLTKDGIFRYIDTDIPTTLSWMVSDAIPAGIYTSVAFTFGIKSYQNKSNMFVNPPESNMWWPDMMGGGYHNMKLNGKWLPPSQTIGNPFNIHLGIGMLKDNITGDTIFIDNSFDVKLALSPLSIHNESHIINLSMNIDSWFSTPNIYDFDTYGGAIMQSQPLMQMIKDNGIDVFSATVVK